MAGAEFHVVALHDQPSLLDEVAKLINNQWPRSIEARRHSIQGSSNDLPCSLLLVERTGGCSRVCGHVRVLRVSGMKGRALVETLLVAPEFRGRGLGRKLMNAAECHVRRLGYEAVHLSTHDQHAFYKHIGYTTAGHSVSGERKCTASLAFTLEQEKIVSDDVIHSEALPSTSDTNVSSKMSVNNASPPLPPLLATPPPPLLAPPPPPPPPVKTIEIDENTIIKWYMKML